MQLTIITGGQTGVDRGALLGALDAGFAVGGSMPQNRRDELGPIPAAIQSYHRACPVPGFSARTIANLDEAHALLVICQDRYNPGATPGTRLTWVGAHERGLPRYAIDQHWWVDEVLIWLRHVVSVRCSAEMKLMVAGPRTVKWPKGEKEAADVMRVLGVLLKMKEGARGDSTSNG